MKPRSILRLALFALVVAFFTQHIFAPEALDALLPAPVHRAPAVQDQTAPLPDAPPNAPGQASAALHVVRIGVVRPALSPGAGAALLEQQRDYLGELSKYTGWDFNVIPVSPDDAADALATGKIDLLMPVEPHIEDAEHYVATKPLPLRDLVCFYRRPDDTRFGVSFESTNVAALDGTRVAVAGDRPDLLAAFHRFCAANGLRMTVVPYETDALAQGALMQGDVDLVLDTATSNTLGETLALAFDSTPTSIAARREDANLIAILDEASDTLDTEMPLTRDACKQAFEAATRRHITYFTPVEQSMIHHLPTLRVALAQDDPTIEISRELIETLCNDTGLSVEFVTAGNASEARAMLKNHTADLMPDIYTKSSRTSDFFFTNLLYEEDYILVGRTDATVPRVGTIAVPMTQTGFLEAVRQRFPGWNILPSTDEQHALAAVSNARADLALSSIVSMQATRNLMLYPNLVLVPSLNKIQIGTSLAIARHEPRLLQSILNKALLRLDPQEQQRILLKHEIHTPPHFSLAYFLAFYPLQTGLLLGGFFLSIALIFFLREIILRRRREAAARAALENYKYQSQTDPLTGLYNKAAMRQMIEHYLLEPPAPGHCHAFFMCDLDHFKAANDTCGHSFGDTILIGFAESLRTIVRSRELIGRFGGDEFVVFLKNGTPNAIPRIAEAIGRAATLVDERERTSNPEAQQHPERPLITVSIGVAVAEGTSEPYDAVFHKADTALYHVKANGRGAWRMYDETMEEKGETEKKNFADDGR